MEKPELKHIPTQQDLQNIEAQGFVFDIYNDKRIVGRSVVNDHEIIFLEDGSEIIRDQNGQFTTWPKEIIRKKEVVNVE